MASDDKKIKPGPAPRTNAPSTDGSITDTAPPKAESGEKAADLSSGYSRGEGQKPVTNSEAFETRDAAFVAQALGTVARAKGMTDIAKAAGLSRENLYKALGPNTHPEFETVMRVLNAIGVRLTAVATTPPQAA